ncbi:1620_t:CDS:10 [Entrophospora sp. SA101]|nr:1620_t:CDS:10 [Entrophospora sp. SA101]
MSMNLQTPFTTNHSHKPLPALPNEISNNDKLNDKKSVLIIPQDSNDLPLDSVSLGHIRKLLKQSLYNCAIEYNPWESIILGIVLDIAEILPKVIDKCGETINNNNEKNDEFNNYKVKFIINLKKIEGGKPNDTTFIYNHFEGTNLFKYDQEPSKDSQVNWIGGTIILRGSNRQINRVDKIFELMVFVACNLKLEMCLFRDHSASRIDQNEGQDAMEIESVLKSTRHTSKPSWFGWLMKHNNLPHVKEHQRQNLHQHQQHDQNRNHQHNHNHSPLSKWSTTKHQNSITKAPSTSNSSIINDNEMAILATNKFSRAIKQMEEIILSSSPGVKFPPPHLLTRLKEEETWITLHTTQYDDGDNDDTFRSYAVNDIIDLTKDYSNGNTILSTNPTYTGKYRTYYSSLSKFNQISLDFKSGLSYLMTNNNSLNGVFKHQSISCSYSKFWSPTSLSPCHNHKIITFEYYNRYNNNADKTLGETLEYLYQQAYKECEEPSCDKCGIDHITTYTHNIGRISITLEKSSDLNLKSLSNNKIILWTQCKLCSSKSPLIEMSNATYYYSFGKYLEILFYNEVFSFKDLCPHVELRDSLVRCFYKDELVAKIEYEHVDLFEMRLPKIQISHDMTKQNNINAEYEDIDKMFMIDEEDTKRLYNETRLEITHFYGSVKQHITTLEEYFISSHDIKLKNNEKNATTTVVAAVDKNNKDKIEQEKGIKYQDHLKMLEELSNTFRREEFELYDLLKRTKATMLNNVRNRLVERIDATKKRLLSWQQTYIPKENQEEYSNINWVEPEYYSSKECYVFPGSPIIIRENEPSSIIAYYLKELLLMKNNVKLTSTQSAPTTPFSENNNSPPLSSTFSSLLNNLSRPSTINSVQKKSNHPTQSPSLTEIDPDGFTLIDQYSTKTKRKLVRENTLPGSTIGDRITYGIETLGSMKGFNLTLSKDKKKNQKDNANIPIIGKLGGIFAKPLTFVKGHRQEEKFNEKHVFPQEKDPPKKKEEQQQPPPLHSTPLPLTPPPTSSGLVDGFTWSRRNSQKDKERDSPHLKHECIHGTKKFTCTVYYATQFDSLRRRCGIENLCIDSLSRCTSWQATGGKSSSTFFKTSDDRLVIKQMVSSWRIAEKDALLKFAPKYFEYMDKAPNTPSVLAKIFGFYTIKIKDTKKNNIILKIDVLVMEHLFFEKTITRRFDLKGIQERHIKEQQQKNDVTLWDGDWVEEAILNDTQFLADANIMDYSLLVGVDDEKKELIAGIVDFIGAYTFYKKLESKGKTIGRNAKEVTVLPPDQYKNRFRDSMEQYFLAATPTTPTFITSPPISPINSNVVTTNKTAAQTFQPLALIKLPSVI